MDAGYAVVDGGRLYVMLTGNIEPNFNKVSVFFDSKAGGENVLTNIPQYDFNNVSQNFGGLTFDTGFEADYHLFGRWGGGNFEIDFADRAGGGSAVVGVNGGASAGPGPIASGVVNPGNNGLNNVGSRSLTGFISSPVEFGFDNSNGAGVLGGTGAADQVAAAAVTTGFEFSVALSDIGNPGFGDLIKIHAAYGNGDNNYHSNQMLAGLAGGTGNLGGDGAGGFTGTLSGVNFNNFAGAQYFEVRVVPEPSTLVLFALALVGAACGRRRS
ncbi:MAG: PEP-CTERM sorting domain-containing protein [Pirellulales bacterium]